MNLESATNRYQAFEALQGYSSERKSDLNQKKLNHSLIKSYILESVCGSFPNGGLNSMFEKSGNTLIQIDKNDDSLYKIKDLKTKEIKGLLEHTHKRYPTIFTHLDTRESDPWAKKIVASSARLDNLWISGFSFSKMLDGIIKINKNRYCRIVFQHTKIFEVANLPEQNDETDFFESRFDEDENITNYGIGSTRITITERLDQIKKILPKLQDVYHPFYALSQLRFPSSGQGGHDLYFYGKLTNRSNDFKDHKRHVDYVIEFYERTTEQIEKITWHGVEKTKIAKNSEGNYLVGAPVVFKFSEPLVKEVFDNFINSTFRNRFNKFRLWGNPIFRGEKKVHVYALDRHLWQPLFMEITDEKIVVMVPQGTCGNTIHRLVTNIQQYLDSNVEVYIGNYNYDEIIKNKINNEEENSLLNNPS